MPNCASPKGFDHGLSQRALQLSDGHSAFARLGAHEESDGRSFHRIGHAPTSADFGVVGIVYTTTLAAIGGTAPFTWATVGDFFGRKNFAEIRGSMSFLYTWGSVLGPVIAGSIYDRTKSYAALFWVLLIMCGVTAALYAMMFQPKPRAMRN